MIGTCPYICNNKNALGYCMTTGCINPKYNSATITSTRTLTEDEVKQEIKKQQNIKKEG